MAASFPCRVFWGATSLYQKSIETTTLFVETDHLAVDKGDYFPLEGHVECVHALTEAWIAGRDFKPRTDQAIGPAL